MVKITTSDLCEGHVWGPWHDGMLTECFLQLTIMSALGLFMFIGGIFRLIQLRKHEFDKDFGKIQIMKITFCVILTLLEVGSLAARFFLNDFTWYQIMADVRDTICWGLCTIVISFEFSSGSAHSWVVRLWWVLEFIGICLIMQALATRDKAVEGYAGYGYDVFMVIVRFGIVTILTIFGLWVTGDIRTAYTKLKDDASASYSAKSYGSFSKLKVENSKNPYKSANIFSKLLFIWPSTLVALGYRRTLNFADLWELPEEDTAEYCTTKLEQNWVDQLAKKQPSLAKAIWATYGRVFVISGLGKLVQDAGTLFGPIVLNKLISFIEDPEAPISTGLYWSLAMFGSFIIQSLGANLNLFISTRVGNQVRSAITSLVYRKSVRISSSARSKFSTGEIINYQAIDATRLAFVTPLLHSVWSSPLQMIVSLYLLYDFLGPSMFAGVGVLLVLTPLNGIAARKMLGYQKILMEKRDKRVRLMSELLSGIRLVKFFNWEENFFTNVNAARNDELGEQKKSSQARAAVMFIFLSTPLWVAAASFTAYTLSGNVLNAEVAFTSLALFNALRIPLGFLPMVLSAMVESKLALARVQKFLMAEDMDPLAVDHSVLDDDYPSDVAAPRTVMKVTHGTFKWGREAHADALTDINLSVVEGELIAVVGPVGCGKSSLLQAFLGEIYKVNGRVAVAGSTAYAPQQAWMQNTTLRENILFGKPYMEAKYQHCINCCELMQGILPNGDMTEIGEKGINLSGGQKQRISLARAMYQDSSIYLLDSPLSAVDAHVGNAHIFNNLILGALGHTTRIFVTHQLDILHKVDRIVVMNNGRISEIGTYNELMGAGLDFSALLAKHVGARDSEDTQEDSPKDKAQKEKGPTKPKGEGEEPAKEGAVGPGPKLGPKPGGRLIGQEERWEGSVSWKIYGRYLYAASVVVTVMCLVLYFLENAGRVSSDWWLSYWSTNATRDNTKLYLGIYVAWGTAGALCTLTRSLSMNRYATLRAARTMHNTMLARILRAPVSFFDTTPMGRILNRFSKDMASLDENLPMALQGFCNTAFGVLAIAFVISFVTPFFLIALLPISYAYYFMQQYYLSSSREVQRLDSISKSPIYALFSETLTGITTIRSFGVAQDFVNSSDKKVDKNNKALFVFNGIARWLAIRLELMCTVVVSLSALFCVIERDNISPGLAGLSLTYALQLTQILNFLVRQSAEVETNIVAVERIVEYSDLPTEAPYDVPEYNVPVGWPQTGEIQFRNLKMRYRPNLDLVIRGITATIKSQEKIGVVGRTGAGKSSLFLGIFRLIEAAEGAIYIDNINIAKIGLSDLRSRLAIIPQDPTLFIGTIRTNLDPFNSYSDRQIWEAIASVHMLEAIQALPGKLDSPVVENGENFSVGQRQLLCLGRALLRNAKILLMDEATASVDMETDTLIQKTIREKFKAMTVITIAHRINTILDSDRVMVLEQGEIAEFDSPQNLADNPNSIFYSLLQESKNKQ